MTKKPKEKYTGPKVTDTATFIQKARWIHGDKYDYSKVEYVNQKTKVEIVCETHGSFWQNSVPHLRGSGCKECAKDRFKELYTKDTQWFVKECIKAHGDYYDYSCVNYTGCYNKVEIICPKHGPFWQEANEHKRGRGCKRCGLDRRSEKQRKPLEDFIALAKKTHGDKYDYSGSVYTSAHGVIATLCPEHGVFEQRASNHINGGGCPQCSRGLMTKTREEFERDSRLVHGNRYDYHKVNYTSNKHKVEIICKKHGTFLQSPSNHIRGAGCPSCAILENSGFGKSGYYGTDLPSNLYVLKLDDSFIKVGLAKDTNTRLYYINYESGYSVGKLYSVPGKANELFELEQKILRKSNLKRFYPEESFAGSTECLYLSELPKVLKIIKEWEEDKKSEEGA